MEVPTKSKDLNRWVRAKCLINHWVIPVFSVVKWISRATRGAPNTAFGSHNCALLLLSQNGHELGHLQLFDQKLWEL